MIPLAKRVKLCENYNLTDACVYCKDGVCSKGSLCTGVMDTEIYGDTRDLGTKDIHKFIKDKEADFKARGIPYLLCTHTEGNKVSKLLITQEAFLGLTIKQKRLAMLQD